ncbi:hypothetical protein A2438_02195, partial [candidate division WOR-1 bacterium RIFOXYC2_FULL_46_14]
MNAAFEYAIINRMKLKIVAMLLIITVAAGIAIAMGGKPKMPDTLYAVLETSKGEIVCQLYPKSAPMTVKNFMLLANGETEWTDPNSGDKVKKPLYNGTIFHRVIPDFMIQGGDPLGRGIGGPGYKFKDEIDETLDFSSPGMLAMANSGPNTNGSQFFITVAPTPWLKGKHTIFGRVVKGQEV